MKKIYFIDDFYLYRKNKITFILLLWVVVVILLIDFLIKYQLSVEKEYYEKNIQVFLQEKKNIEHKEKNKLQNNNGIIQTFDEIMKIKRDSIVINHLSFEGNHYQIDGEAKNFIELEQMLGAAKKGNLNFIINDISGNPDNSIIHFDVKSMP
ncbi:hypothetical protein ACG9XW_18140 [Acinetobacter guillouiae]|uniref:hypothetical protein n=1 Tax=Acinetobacter guillouiae TaxID=106649 RepID=UPI003AF90B3C